jgi:hypothetical protein
MKGLSAFVQFDGSMGTGGQNGDTRFTEAAFFSDRVCFDAGNEYGFFRWIGMGTGRSDHYDDGYYFYYSIYTNCNIPNQGLAFYCGQGPLPSTVMSQWTVTHRISGLTDGNLYYFDAYPYTANNATTFRVEVLDSGAGYTYSQCSIDGGATGNCVHDYDTTSDTDIITSTPTSSWPSFFDMSKIDTGYVFVGTNGTYDYDPNTDAVTASPNISGAQLVVSAVKVGK